MITARDLYRRLPGVLKIPFRQAYSLVPFPWTMGPTFGRLYTTFSRSERRSSISIAESTLNQVQQTTRYAASTVPHYQKAFATLGVSPDEIRSLKDFSALPITEKEALRAAPRDFLSSAVSRKKVRTRTTSGSTGTPMTVFSTNLTWMAERAMIYRGWKWAGYHPTDRVASSTLGLVRTGGPDYAPFSRYRNALEISPTLTEPRSLDSYAKLLVEFDPHFVRTFPSTALFHGAHFRKQGLRLPSLKAILTQSEMLTPQSRARIESDWGCPVRDFYGLQEKCAAISECEEGNMHVHSEFGYVELLPVPNSPYSKIIATGFWNNAMPLLRYETGDLAMPADKACSCGRTLPVVRSLQGRIEEYLVTSDGKYVRIFAIFFSKIPHIRQCQVIQERNDLIRFRVIPTPEFGVDQENAIRNVFSDHMGQATKVIVERATDLERTSSGKIPFIISHIS